MARSRTRFRCSACGGAAPRWSGRCPACGEWNLLVEEAVTEAGVATGPAPSAWGRGDGWADAGAAVAVSLGEV
ncbi:MAG TPA: hypothetical protein VLZ77_14175, partial [Acidimicrobiales bacterium]|nr:hypothetical protein [Acidimicrobiales bacterium]